MALTKNEVMQFIEEQNVKFARLAFCDILGNLKNISISIKELPKAFERGIGFDASAIKGFLNIEDSDLFLFPEPDTITILPWQTSQGREVRFFCVIKRANGDIFEGDLRYKLRETQLKAFSNNLEFSFGPECEFYLFKTDEYENPTLTPVDEAGYFDIAPRDQGENVRREICLTLDEMGFYTERSHHEQGPGQNEIDFRFSSPLKAADNFITFKSVVQTISSRLGLFASFLPKPLIDQSGNGLHINISVKNDQALNSYMMAGILKHIKELTLFLNPLTNSYLRLGNFEAPLRTDFGPANRSLLVRIPPSSQRFEVRSPDPSCNPYLVFNLLLKAGIQGIQEKLDPNEIKSQELPASLEEAIKIAENSDFVRNNLNEITFNKFLEIKKAESESLKDFSSQLHHYFSIV
ncbi:MAG: glutamine synthetase family protein [Sphaerochaetaceae bacterium]